MNLTDKVAHATALIRHFPEPYALMWSGGKDSMVLLHLIREVLPKNELRTHAYPIDIIWHRTPYFPAKNEFGEGVVRSWGLEVYDYPPLCLGIKCKPERLELVSQYRFGSGGMMLPLNTEEPTGRRDYVCGLEWLKRPKSTLIDWPWATVFQGHKNSDVDPYEGPMPLAHDASDAGGVNLVFPLRHFNDSDIWEYIHRHNVPYDKRRYAGNLEIPDKWLNPDWINACVKCVDPREEALEVMCPKLGKMVPNVSRKVLRLDELPPYIVKHETDTVNAG